MDTERWSTLSLLLDELLEMEPAARERRLEEIGLADASLGGELRKLIALEDERPLVGALVRALHERPPHTLVEPGLDLLLDGLAAQLEASRLSRTPAATATGGSGTAS